MIVGSCPVMSTLSDKNMRLGDVLIATREKTTVLVTTVARIVYLTHSSLMQLFVALSLHFGWGSQLNISEMFSIDITRWMISKYMLMNERSTCLGILPITIEPLTFK